MKHDDSMRMQAAYVTNLVLVPHSRKGLGRVGRLQVALGALSWARPQGLGVGGVCLAPLQGLLG